MMGSNRLTSLSIFLLCASALVLVHGCGMSTHINIAHRAGLMFDYGKYPQYRQMISKHHDALQGGAPFPDWGYACNFHDVGEYTHWEPFQKVAVEYIREKYPQPWDEETEKLVVFLLGVNSHYLADINWHGLGEAWPRWSTPTAHGMIRIMGGVNFGCNGTLCDDAHSVADTGGEFVVGAEMNLAFETSEWYVPVADLVEIYHRAGYAQINASSISQCMLMFFAGVKGEPLVAEMVLPKYASKSPFLVEFIREHFMGGLDDNAIWSGLKWINIIDWLQTGVPTNSSHSALSSHFTASPIAALTTQHIEQIAARTKTRLSNKAIATLAQSRDVFEAIAVIRALDTDVLHMIWELVQKLGLDKRVFMKPTPSGRGITVALLPQVSAERQLTADKLSWSSFTHSLTSCLSSPLQCVENAAKDGVNWVDHVKHAAEEKVQSILPKSADATLSGDGSNFEYYGRSIASGDFDGDGVEDLAVGMPGFSQDVLAQIGAVQVIYRKKDGSTKATQTLIGAEGYARFGWKLASIDFNLDGIDDLVVSSPTAQGEYDVDIYAHDHYRGKVQVFYGVKNGQLAASANVRIMGDEHEEFANMGYNLLVADLNHDSHNDLIISTPFAYGGDGTANQTGQGDPYSTGTLYTHRGLVAVFLCKFGRTWSSKVSLNQADWIARGEHDFDLFGFSLAFVPPSPASGPLLVVGSPGYKVSVGRVLAFTFSQNDVVSLAWVVEGQTTNTAFGHSLAAGTFYGSTLMYLAVSAPWESTDSTLHIQAGVVRVLPLNTFSGNTSISSLEARTTLIGSQPFGRLGLRLAAADLRKTGVYDLVISQGTATTVKGFESGEVIGFHGGPTFPVGSTSNPFAGDWYALGPNHGARLGFGQLHFFDYNNDGVLDVLAGTPFASGATNANDEQGSVFVYLS
eukprot:TRINITY_DN1079_c0_g1_i3.p1 TRINITY_DN1079_c0_g1~~TRINITY_DN1079_c0_g1_i3.p1  ORF type:complete len:912 (+),score=356.28 TRINITY_DN1079_c0_g1_i3:1157-3892(+)